MENRTKDRVLNPLKFRAAVFDNMLSEDVGYSNYSYWRSTIRTFFKNKAVLVLVVLIALIIVMGFVYPMVSPVEDPNRASLFPLTWNQDPAQSIGSARTSWAVISGPEPGTVCETLSCWPSALPCPMWVSA